MNFVAHGEETYTKASTETKWMVWVPLSLTSKLKSSFRSFGQTWKIARNCLYTVWKVIIIVW